MGWKQVVSTDVALTKCTSQAVSMPSILQWTLTHITLTTNRHLVQQQNVILDYICHILAQNSNQLKKSTDAKTPWIHWKPKFSGINISIWILTRFFVTCEIWLEVVWSYQIRIRLTVVGFNRIKSYTTWKHVPYLFVDSSPTSWFFVLLVYYVFSLCTELTISL